MAACKTVTPASWLNDTSAAPCPAWCDGGHKENDHPEDRMHYSPRLLEFRPTLLDPYFYHQRKDGSGLYDHGEWSLSVFTEQKWRDREATIVIEPDMMQGPVGEGLRLTVDEARKLRRALSRALNLASSKTKAERRPQLEVVPQAS
ncbi:DUF6907 domain-containing protein [Amycolatopsis sp. CB00013]|uniref:DUF6907 domain-containing protein n=1 Tax=Amycolatopsis sp. CB00013 TaxID=1703945 RepID=UPI00116140F7|nr:hypothetical protein [Amycolatopsis sp. CB00013]